MVNTNERFQPHNIINDKCWNTAIYVRLSDEDRNKMRKEDLSRSLENQIQYIKNHIAYTNDMKLDSSFIKIYDIYADDDFSGMDFERAAFKRMMNDVKNDVIDCIVVKNLSRFGRYDTQMQMYLEEELEKSQKQVRLIAIGDNYDSLYHEVDMKVKLTLMLNREYSENQHRNVTVAMHTMQKQGKYVGAFAPYGYKKDPKNKHHLVTDPYAAEIVKRIFQLYLDGVSMKEIALILTKDGVVNRTAYKKMQNSKFVCSQKISDSEVHWTTDAIKNILINEVYTGTLVQGKTVQKRLIDKKPTPISSQNWIRVEHTHEAIIEKDDWELAQSLMKKIKHDTSKPDEITIFKGLLKCGDCGHAMRKRWDKHTTKEGEVHKYLYYNCSTFRDFSKNTKGFTEEQKACFPKCTSHYISDNLLRQIVLNDINTIISQLKNLGQTIKKEMYSSKSNNYKDTIQAEIISKQKNIDILSNRMKNAKNKWLDGIFSDEEFKETKIECQNSIQQYQKEITTLQQSLKKPQEVFENAWVKNLLQYGQLTELDRATVVYLIDKIYIYQDKHIEIVYKFSGEFDALFMDKFQ